MLESALNAHYRYSVNRPLGWRKNAPTHIEISVCGFTDALLPFPEGHACTKDGVSYENHKNGLCV